MSERSSARGRGTLVGVRLEGLTEHRLGISYPDVDRHDRNRSDPVNFGDEFQAGNRGRRFEVELPNDVYAGVRAPLRLIAFHASETTPGVRRRSRPLGRGRGRAGEG